MRTSILFICLALPLASLAQSEVGGTFTVQKLTSQINSEAEESKPMLVGNTLYFVRTLHERNVGGQYAGQDIWRAERQANGSWSEATNDIGDLNDVFNNALLGISPDGKQWYLLNSYRFRVTPKVSIASVSLDEVGTFSKPEDIKIRNYFPTEQYYDAFVVPNEDVIILSMDYEGSEGSEDLYVLQKNSRGKYTELTNLGPNVNTNGHEIAPFMTPDGKRLYFASNGHDGLGGTDIFFTERLDSTWTNWSEPVNLGAPVNSEGFDAYYYETDKGDIFFASRRGDDNLSDLYEAVFISEPAPPIVVVVEEEEEAEPAPPIEEAPEVTEVQDPDPAPIMMPDPKVVYFALDSDQLSPTAERTLRGVMQTWDQRRELTIILEGHACQLGEAAYNDGLSKRRAEAVQAFLKKNGYADLRYQIKAKGEQDPVVPHSEAGSNPKNRCVRITFEQPGGDRATGRQ